MRIEIEPKELVELIRIIRNRLEVRVKDTKFEAWRKTKVVGPIKVTDEDLAKILAQALEKD